MVGHDRQLSVVTIDKKVQDFSLNNLAQHISAYAFSCKKLATVAMCIRSFVEKLVRGHTRGDNNT